MRGASGAPARMSNVLSDTKREQVLALGQLGWSLREIERKTGVRRETISGYLTVAEIAIRPERGRKLTAPKSGQFRDHRLRRVKSGQFEDHRLQSAEGFVSEHLRSVPGLHRRAAEAGTECNGRLPGLGGPIRVSRPLPLRSTLHPDIGGLLENADPGKLAPRTFKSRSRGRHPLALRPQSQ